MGLAFVMLLVGVSARAQDACDRGCLPGRLRSSPRTDNAWSSATVCGTPSPQIAEGFKIERGLIGPVESVLHQVPYGHRIRMEHVGRGDVEHAAVRPA